MMAMWPLLGMALLIIMIVMVVTWVLARRWDNYSVVDAVWAFSFFLVTVLYVFLAPGWWGRKALVLVAVSAWSLRLSFFLYRRIKSHHPDEDARYKKLRCDYGQNVPQRFLLFFIYQGFSVVLLSLPFAETLMNPQPGLHWLEGLGFTVSVFSLVGEAVADAQAQRFKSDPSHRGKVCQVGLWRYSRHPNYFFESCIWWGFWLMAMGTDGAAYTVFAPLVILFLLLKVTGVPPSEEQALKKRGDEYRRYQQSTSMFVPWLPRKVR